MQLFRRKGSRFWWCRGRDVDGARWWESTKQTDHAAAAIAARVLERARLLAPDPATDTTVRLALAALAADDERTGRPKTTRGAHATKGGHLSRVLGADRAVSELGAEVLRGYVDARLGEGAHRHTIHKELGVLTKSTRLAGVPVPKAAMPDLGRFYTPRDRWLPEAEYRRLLLALPLDRRDWLVAWCHTGVRYGELHALRPEHVDVPHRLLYVPVTKTKGGARTVPLDPDALAMFRRRLAALPPGAPRIFPLWLKPNVNQMFRRACKRAKIAAVSPNDLRRTFCSWLAQADVGETTCARLLGHSSSTMVRRVYAQLAVGHLARAVARLPQAARRQPRRQSGVRGKR